MTSPYAIAAVTAVLRSRITAFLTQAGVSAAVGNVSVTALPPDRLVTGQQEANQVNIFMHRVSHNPGWANLGVPPRDSSGVRVAAPPLALDLHYLICAYGQDLFTAEILLGHALMALHEEPVLGRDTIRAALTPNPPDPSLPTAVASSRLAEQVEQIRLSPSTVNEEEIARLWAAFTAPYRPSAFYLASVVLIDDDRSFRAALPVQAVSSISTGLDGPQVTSVVPADGAATPLTSDVTIVITGRNLGSEGTTVRLGVSIGTPSSVRDTVLEVPLPSFVPPLQAGLAGLVVVRDVALGLPATAHQVLSSQAVPVAIQPAVSFGAGAVSTGSTRMLAGVPVASGSVVASLEPPVGAEQQVSLVLSEVGAPPGRAPRAAALAAPPTNGVVPPATDTATVTFSYVDVPRGSYVARLRVDGVESPVTAGGDGRYAEPAVTL